jgi:hypothetical protein
MASVYDPNWRDTALKQGKDVNGAEFADMRAMESSQPKSSVTGSSSDYIQKAIDQQKKAVQPVIDSYNSSIPETQKRYADARTQLENQRTPLKDRYANLLASINNQQTTDVNAQTQVTNNELGKRGILGSSGVAGQEIQNAVSPLIQRYAGMSKDATIAQQDAENALNSQISGLTGQETDALRAIQNAIAQMTAGASQTGTSQGMQGYQFDVSTSLQQQQMAQQQQQQAIQNALNQAAADEQKRQYEQGYNFQQTQYNDAKAKANQAAAAQQSSNDSLAQAIARITGNTSGMLTPGSENKPKYNPNITSVLNYNPYQKYEHFRHSKKVLARRCSRV